MQWASVKQKLARLLALAVPLPLLACAPAQIADPAAGLPASAPPNVVVLLVDDLGWRDLGYTGSRFYETPNIDALAARSTVFENAYSASPVCSPSRASLQTGLDPVRLGITDWIPGFRPREDAILSTPAIPDALPRDRATLGERFKAAGYATMFAGKWHLGSDGDDLPQARGYDRNAGGYGTGQPRGKRGREYFSPYGNPELADGPEGEFLTQRLGRESAAFIERNRGRPFLLAHNFYQVHTPLNPAPDHIEYFRQKAAQDPACRAENTEHGDLPFGRRTSLSQCNPEYASMIAAVDDVVGDIVGQLRSSGLLENTIIVFTSDNGGLSALGSGGVAPTSNAPLRGSKGWLFEGGVRVPLLIFAPDHFEAGQTRSDPAITMDIVPTLLELAGLENAGLDGRSLARPGPQERALFWHFPHYHANGWRPGGAMRVGRWKLIEFFEDGETLLFDLAADPYETNNLAASLPETAAAMRERLKQWRREMGARMPTRRQ